MSGKKILFLNLDAVLVNPTGKISKKSKKAIHELLDQGHYLLAATGRPVESGRIVLKELGLQLAGCYMIAYNGAVLYDCSADRILFERTIPVQDVYRLFANAHAKQIHVHTYEKNKVLADQRTPELDMYLRLSKLSCKMISDIESALSVEPHKVMLIDMNGFTRLNEFMDKNLSWTSRRLNYVFSSDYFLEYTPMGTDRGTGFEYLCNFLNIPIENSVAIGNDLNDIPVLKKAKITVALSHAPEVIKQEANYITTTDNSQEAISEVIEKFIMDKNGREG